jgi:replicative DNA helicase
VGERDLKDLHLAGDLDMDAATDPMALPELPLEEAEDLFIAVCCAAPRYANHSRVGDAHLSDRGKILLNVVRAVLQQGWPQVTADHLEGQLAGEVSARYWAQKPAKDRPKTLPALDLGTIPRRLLYPDPLTSIGYAEDVLLQAFEKQKYVAIHMKAANIAMREGPAAARVWLAEREARLTSLTAGVRWSHAGDVAARVINDMRQQVLTPAGAGRLIATNFPEIDRVCCSFDAESATTVAGWNGHGKSTFALQLLQQMSITGNTPTRYISAEDRMVLSMKRVLIWLLEDLRRATRISTNQVQSKDAPDGFTLDDVEHLETVAKRIADNMPLEFCHVPGCTIEQAEAAVIESARAGARVACFDYLSAIAEPPRYDTLKWRNYCFKRLKAAAVSNGMHLIICAQLKRPGEGAKGEGVTRDETKPPNRYMIAYCSAAEEGSENVLLPHRHQKNEYTTDPYGKRRPLDTEAASIIVDKAKDGAVGTIELGWCNSRHFYTRRAADVRQGNLMDKGVNYGKGGQSGKQDDF